MKPPRQKISCAIPKSSSGSASHTFYVLHILPLLPIILQKKKAPVQGKWEVRWQIKDQQQTTKKNANRETERIHGAIGHLCLQLRQVPNCSIHHKKKDTGHASCTTRFHFGPLQFLVHKNVIQNDVKNPPSAPQIFKFSHFQIDFAVGVSEIPGRCGMG